MSVSLQACEDYEIDRVRESLRQVLEPLGGMKAFVPPKARVVIKPNLLMSKKPEDATTTHPALVRAVAEEVQRAGAGDILIADSPGGLYNKQLLKAVYSTAGMEEVSRQTGVPLNYNLETVEVSHPAGETVKGMTLIRPVVEADVVIDLCKLKTHGMTMYTGAVKNLFGCIPGTMKAEYHFRLQQVPEFCGMLVDIATFVKPALCIMDAVVGMEGAGPSGGTPRKLGLLMASANPFELDLMASSLIGYRPDEVPTVAIGIRRGLSPGSPEELTWYGTDPAPYRCNFEKPNSRGVDFLRGWPEWLRQAVQKLIRPRPVFLYDVCVGCGECARRCPAETIKMIDGRPVVDLKGCIRCFCCQELCPRKAVDIKRSKLMKFINNH